MAVVPVMMVMVVVMVSEMRVGVHWCAACPVAGRKSGVA